MTDLGRFECLFEKLFCLKNLIFEMTTITSTLNINNMRTTRAKYINLHTIRKLGEYSFKNVLGKGNVYFYRF